MLRAKVENKNKNNKHLLTPSPTNKRHFSTQNVK